MSNRKSQWSTILKGLAAFAVRRCLVVNLNVNVTNVCTQNCPHCNALPEGVAGKGRYMTLAELERAVSNLPLSPPPSISFSGGEPTVCPDLPDMLRWAGKRCAFGINLNTNLYGNRKRLFYALDAALEVNARIDVSFDGFGEVADTLRGAKDVARTVKENLSYLARRKQEVGSKSVVTVHTVLNDANLDDVPGIFEMSRSLGFRQTIAPVNRFPYQEQASARPEFALSDGGKLRRVLQMALELPNLGQSKRFVATIPAYLRGTSPKLCPYLHPIFKTYKVFLAPGGELTLCDRTASLGKLIEQPLTEMLKSTAYKRELEKYKSCQGCWIICFVEPMLRLFPWKARARA